MNYKIFLLQNWNYQIGVQKLLKIFLVNLEGSECHLASRPRFWLNCLEVSQVRHFHHKSNLKGKRLVDFNWYNSKCNMFIEIIKFDLVKLNSLNLLGLF